MGHYLEFELWNLKFMRYQYAVKAKNMGFNSAITNVKIKISNKTASIFSFGF